MIFIKMVFAKDCVFHTMRSAQHSYQFTAFYLSEEVENYFDIFKRFTWLFSFNICFSLPQVLAWGERRRARTGNSDAGHSAESQQHCVLLSFFLLFLITHGAIFIYWSLPRSLYTSIKQTLSTSRVLGDDCANHPESPLSCLGLEDSCCTECSLELSISSFMTAGKEGEKKKSKWKVQ